ncbi:GNAT family N-acetyltransferase [Rhizobium sp. TRM95111]|uniref:GNAT family N-acetyltransferase n=1 Tax=Rhizobium alarense TaxID=2846851 RepID=UPI001F2D1EDF|nr:GNAT family N-acetyltransferase [Rhizobium alarense]MCF3640507.1 GNAT family N-acetyltransferase [Rhizobium alarense]
MMLGNGYTDVPPGKLAAVVTSLEMRERPGKGRDPEQPGLTLRHVAAPATDWYRDLYRRIGTEWLWVSRLVMPAEELTSIIADPAVEVWAVLREGKAEGLLELDFREAGSCELAFFGLTPAIIGQGAGRWLMNRAIERAWSRSIRRFWVHTCSIDHPSALGFYIRSGFVPYQRQIEVFDDPRLSGLLPRDAAPHVPLIVTG